MLLFHALTRRLPTTSNVRLRSFWWRFTALLASVIVSFEQTKLRRLTENHHTMKPIQLLQRSVDLA